jgi:hypothetical protein
MAEQKRFVAMVFQYDRAKWNKATRARMAAVARELEQGGPILLDPHLQTDLVEHMETIVQLARRARAVASGKKSKRKPRGHDSTEAP